MTATTVIQHNPGTWQISLPFQGEGGVIGAYLLADTKEIALIDPGPGSTIEALLEGIQMAGFNPTEVTHLLLTHIHLDHAGAAGALLQHMPRAKVYVHGKGVKHMIDPSKLVSSAKRIYGTKMKQLWGEIVAVPEERMQVLNGGDVLEVAGQRLEVHYTPGHAIHHVVFFNAHTGELYCGDAAGVRLQNIDFVRPPTPPPDLDLEDWSDTIDAIKRLHPDVLYLAHFGPTREVARHMQQLREKLVTWGDLILNSLRAGQSEDQILVALVEQGDQELRRVTQDEEALKRYEIGTNYAMTVQGYIRYWQKKHPERIEG
jgi:glyoxylase-like metal-dependent hydrolase (beta-lactamase superfamily II)